MHEYDAALKSLLISGTESLRALTPLKIDHWLNVDLPLISNRRVDLLGETEDNNLVHIEMQSTHDPKMAGRMIEYSVAVWRVYDKFPKQVVLYVGEPPLRMTGHLAGPDLSFACQIIDIRELDAERLLNSPHLEDNVIAVLARVKDQRAVIKRVLARIATSNPEVRAKAMGGLLILAGLRRLATEVVKQEASRMPILDDIIDHPIIGPRIRMAEEQARKGGLEKGLKQGLEQGLEQGLQQGRHDGEMALVLRLIEKRFGSPSTSLTSQLQRMRPQELEAVALRLLNAGTLEEVLG